MLQTRPSPLETRRRPAISTSALTYPVALLMAEIGDACDGPADAMGERIAHALRVAAAMPDLLTAGTARPARRLLRPPHHRQRSRRPFHAALDRLGAGPVQPAACPRHLVRLCRGRKPAHRDALRLRRRSAARPSRAIQRCASRAMLVSPRPGLNKSTGLVMPGALARSRSTPMASKARASERM